MLLGTRDINFNSYILNEFESYISDDDCFFHCNCPDNSDGTNFEKLIKHYLDISKIVHFCNIANYRLVYLTNESVLVNDNSDALYLACEKRILKLIKENSKSYSSIYKPTIFSYSDFGISKDIKNLTDKTLLNKTVEYVKMKDFLKWLKGNYKNKIGVYSGPRKESKMSELKELLKKNEDFKVLSFN